MGSRKTKIKGRFGPSQENTTVIAVRVLKTVYADLIKIAEEEGRTLTDVARVIITNKVRRLKKAS